MTFNDKYKISQNYNELMQFIDFALAHGVSSYLEVGSRDGGTFYEIVSRLGQNATATAIDLPGGNWGKTNSEKRLHKRINELQKQGYNARAIIGCSGNLQTIKEAKKYGPYDLTFIDGCHLYESVARDWNNYKSISRMVAFHDIAGTGIKTKHGLPVEVPVFWQEIKQEYDHVEIIDGNSRMGIGVILQ